MKTKLAILGTLAILLFTQCKKETTVPVSDEKAIFLEQAKQFVKTKAPTADFDRLDWGNAIAYKKDDIYKIVRVPFTGNNQPGQKAVYLSYNNGQFSGNYFEMVNNTVTTLSLDNVRKCVAPVTGNGQVGNYTLYENGQAVQDGTGLALYGPRPPLYLYGDFNLYYAMNILGLGQGYVGGDLSGQTGTVSYLEAPLEGGGGGGGNIIDFSVPVAILAGWLNLSYEQAVWLQNNPARTDELIAYLQTSTNPLANTIALGHLTRMIADPGYLSFVQQHHTTYGNQPMWWENPIYLEPFGEGPFGGWAINYLIQHPTESFNTLYYSYLTEVENNLIDPCLKNVVNAITKGKHRSIVFDMFKKLQADAKFPLKFKYEEVSSLPSNAPAATQDAYAFNSPNTIGAALITIKLNTSALIGKSKEYISSIILHEIAHAIRKANVVMGSFPAPPQVFTQAEEHAAIIEAKLPLTIYQSLIDLFPNASAQEMKDLAIGGFKDVLFSPSETLLNNNLTQLITSADFFPGIDISNAYHHTIPQYKDLTKGTICN